MKQTKPGSPASTRKDNDPALRARRLLASVRQSIQAQGGLLGILRHVHNLYRLEGLRGVGQRLGSALAKGVALAKGFDRNNYAEWVRRYDTVDDGQRQAIQQTIAAIEKPPLVSVVMSIHNPDLRCLTEAIHSIQRQSYPYWELCVADDASTEPAVRQLLEQFRQNEARIKVVFNEPHGQTAAALNKALGLATGDWTVLFDQRGLLSENTLFYVVQAAVANADTSMVYSDEDKIDMAGVRQQPYFKPDWNPDLFLSQNMLGRFTAFRSTLVEQLGGLREGYEGAQNYDMALRCIEQIEPAQILHIPRVLYHEQLAPDVSTLTDNEKKSALLAGQQTINDHFKRTGTDAKAELVEGGLYRARYALPFERPLVSLIIPTRNGLQLIRQCVESILTKTTYENYEIIIVDNNSDDPDTLQYFASLANEPRIRVLRDEREFNYSALNNGAVTQARGDYLCLVNNDIEVISPDWLSEMVSLAAQPGVGAVGARLWYPDDTLQHGGVVTGICGVAGHIHKHLPRGHPGYFGRAQAIQTLSVVTAACLLIKKDIYLAVDGLDEINLKVAFNDVDFCLRVQEAGYRNVWTPYAELYHHESASRGREDTFEKYARFGQEAQYMQRRWGHMLRRDPAYNPNLTLDADDFSLAWPPRCQG